MYLDRRLRVAIFIIFIAASTAFFLPVSQSQSSTSTPRPTSLTYYVTGNTINARACPRTDCDIVTTFSRGQSIRVLGSETGTSVSGSTTWYRARYEGQDIYIHSSLVSRRRPSSTSSSVQPTRATNSNPIQPTSVPADPVVPPTENVSVAPPAASYSCNCSKSCEQMASCEEAYYQLNQCGCSRRDSDGDGVPCESICSGG